MRFTKFILFSFLFPLFASAGVNLKNGNFYINYFDVILPGGGKNLEISRTYNSKATKKGWFGFGWGSEFETSLTVAADGSVVINENGSGAQTRFVPNKPVNVEEAAANIIKAMQQKSSMSEEVVKNLSKKLMGDEELRQAYAIKYGVKAEISEGSELISNSRGLQKVIKLNNGFKRQFNNGKFELYNLEGQLTEINDLNDYKITLEYKDGFVSNIKDTMGKQLFFEWFGAGKVKSISSTSNQKSEYKFDGFNLVESKDIAGNVYKYSYDANHNLTSVIYSDGAKMEVTYTPKTQFVDSVKSRDGQITKYKYESDPKNPTLHYWTLVTKVMGGKEVTNRYEYEMKVKDDGSQYNYRTFTDIDGLKTETIYSECCQNPVRITEAGDTTSFEYNEKGLLTKKTATNGKFVKLEYDEKLNKINKVTNNDGWTQFDYDKKGNLAKAQNDQGKAVLLIYDLKGRISKMVDTNKNKNVKRAITFKYNASGKPTEIAMSKVGKIDVTYDSFGEIKEVKSDAGPQMAMQVTQAFQNLLAIVRPAGVNLNM
jgi:YD repeat-containing protein